MSADADEIANPLGVHSHLMHADAPEVRLAAASVGIDFVPDLALEFTRAISPC